MEIKKPIEIKFAFKGIEVLQSLFNPLPNPELKSEDFLFNLQLEQKIDRPNKSIQVLVKVEIRANQINEQLASLTTVSLFYIDNFEEIPNTADGMLVLPEIFSQTLTTLSISTTRGILFTFLKGTYLHYVILPIVDPAKFIQQQNQ